MDTKLLNVPQPADATGIFGDSIHFSAISQPCGPSAATHATVAPGNDPPYAFSARPLQVLLGHARIVRDQARQIHRVVIPGVIKIQRELIVRARPLLYLFQLRQPLTPRTPRLLHAVIVVEHPFVAFLTYRFQFFEDFFVQSYKFGVLVLWQRIAGQTVIVMPARQTVINLCRLFLGLTLC